MNLRQCKINLKNNIYGNQQQEDDIMNQDKEVQEQNNICGDEQYQNYETQQLLAQLQHILTNDQVRNNLSFALHQRIQNILNAYGNNEFMRQSSNQRHPLQQIKLNGNHKQNIQSNYKESNTTNSNNISQQNGKSQSFKTNRHQNYSNQLKSIQLYDGQCLFPQNQENQYQWNLNHYEKQPNKQKNNTKRVSSKSKSKEKKNKSKNKNKVQIHKNKLSKECQNNFVKTPSKTHTKIRITDIYVNKDRLNNIKQKNSSSKDKQKKLKSQSISKNHKFQCANNTVKKERVSSIKPSISVTAYTTRNNQNVKQIQKGRSSSKNKQNRRLKTVSSTSKLSGNSGIYSMNLIQLKNKSDKHKKNHTQHRLDEEEDIDFSKPFVNSKSSNNLKQQQSSSDIEKVYTIQFVNKIEQIQKNIQIQESALTQRIKLLKMELNNEKSALQQTNNQILSIKQQINNHHINNAFLANKKKQNRIKLQHIWNEVKVLNSSLTDVKEKNIQININLNQEMQLIQMYKTVIEQIKSQLKIQTDQRDSFKRILKQSKKNQQAFKLKANSTKQRTQLILNSVRDSINKWAV